MNRHLLILGLALGACGDPEERSTTRDYIHATIIEPNCATANCHSAGVAGGPIYDVSTGGPIDCQEIPIDLSTPESMCEDLFNVRGFDQTLSDYALDGTDFGFSNDCGDNPYPQMPPDVPLPDGEIRLLKDWLAQGKAVACAE